MDLRAIRTDIGVLASNAKFNAWSYMPSDPQDLPAAVVGGIKSMKRLNRLVTQLQIGVIFYVNFTDPEDAATRLDTALSTGNPDSFIDQVDSLTQADQPSWRSIRFESAGPYTVYTLPSGDPSGADALGVEVILELTA
jgi:hypothetical protein